jgi:hypothetical protein
VRAMSGGLEDVQRLWRDTLKSDGQTGHGVFDCKA